MLRNPNKVLKNETTRVSKRSLCAIRGGLSFLWRFLRACVAAGPPPQNEVDIDRLATCSIRVTQGTARNRKLPGGDKAPGIDVDVKRPRLFELIRLISADLREMVRIKQRPGQSHVGQCIN